MTPAFLGIDTGSISTKGVIIDDKGTIMARSYLWTEGNPTDAAKRVVDDLSSQIDHDNVKVVAVGTTGSARRLVGAILNATVVKNEITAHAVGTTHLHPDVRTILEIGGQDSKIICVENGIATDYAMNTLAPLVQDRFFQVRLIALELKWKTLDLLPSLQSIPQTLPPAVPFLPKAILYINSGRLCPRRCYCRAVQSSSN